MKYDQNLENCLASILYHNPELIDQDLVAPADFFSDVRDYIEKMIRIYQDTPGRLFDIHTIGRVFPVPTDEEVKDFPNYASALHACMKENRIKNIGNEVNEIAFSGIDSDEIILKLSKLIDSLNQTKYDTEEFKIENQITDWETEFLDPTIQDYIPTGIDVLDEMLGGGIAKTEFIIIAGEPGEFKSTLMYNMALNLALRGKEILIFTYEVSRKEVIRIFISMLAQIDSRIIKSKKAGNTSLLDDSMHNMKDKIIRAANKLKTLPIHIIDSNARMADIKMLGIKNKPDAIFVDYIQIMPDVTMDKVGSIENISRQFKLLANYAMLNIPVIALSQFKKEATASDGVPIKRRLSDLKWSSSLGQDPNIAIFVSKDIRQTAEGKTYYIELSLAKNREGDDAKSGNVREIPVNAPTHTIGDPPWK